LTAWNGLMLAAFAESAAILECEEYLRIARKNADFILGNLQKDGFLLRTFKDGRGKLNAYLEDYANFADGLIELFQVSGEIEYLKEAKRLIDTMIAEFWDAENGGFYFTASNHESLPVRSKDFYDNAMPSGNSVAADVLLKLSKLVGDEDYENYARTILLSVSAQIKKYPQAFGRLLSALEFYLSPTKEIVVLGKKGNELEREIWREFMPDKVVVLSEDGINNTELIRFCATENRLTENRPFLSVKIFVCQKPVVIIEELREQLR
jgi:uncharacterized protein YyaL (SSP411 family)